MCLFDKKIKESVDKWKSTVYIYIVKQILTKINKTFQRLSERSEMMDYKEMFDQELISLELKGENEVEVFQQVAKHLTELGFVNEGYLNGIITREEKFPTGLITQHVNIALPHSDPEYVEKPFVYIARLKDEVKVKQMGDSQEMKVKNLFFLGIKDPKGQVGLLQAFMELFMKEEFVTEFINEKDINKIYQLFTNNI